MAGNFMGVPTFVILWLIQRSQKFPYIKINTYTAIIFCMQTNRGQDQNITIAWPAIMKGYLFVTTVI